jgi:hypothetical protein
MWVVLIGIVKVGACRRRPLSNNKAKVMNIKEMIFSKGEERFTILGTN